MITHPSPMTPRQPAIIPSLPLSRRPVDIALIVFFCVNLFFITYIVDLEQLVIRDAAGTIQGVRYEELAPMLLNELQKQNQQIAQLQQQLAAMKEVGQSMQAALVDLQHEKGSADGH